MCDVCKVVIVVAMLVTLLFVLAAVLGAVAVTLCTLARFISTPACWLEWKEMKGVDHTAGKLLTMQQRQQLEKLESTLSANESLSPRAVAALFYMDDMESCECGSVRVIVIERVTFGWFAQAVPRRATAITMKRKKSVAPFCPLCSS